MIFIFGEKDLQNPIFISFDLGYKNFTIAKGIEKVDEKSWKVEVLKVLKEKKEATDALKKGVTIEDGKNKIKVFLKKKFIIQKIVVLINDEEIKGHEFLQIII